MLDRDSRYQSDKRETCREPECKASVYPQPKASVIIGTFDCEPYVEECVRSVMSQTEKRIEIIVVDDGSTDGTLQVLKELQLEDSRVTVHSQCHTGYPGPGRNRGIALANGQYVAFLDGDDLYHPSKVEESLKAFEACPEADVVIHDLFVFEGRPDDSRAVSHLSKRRFLESAKDYLDLVKNDFYLCHKDLYKFMSLWFFPFHTSSIAIRRDVLLSERPCFREDWRIGEDCDLWLRLAKQRRFAFVDRGLSYYRQRAGSVTGDQELFLIRGIEMHQENLERAKDTFSKSELRLYEAKIAGLFFDLGYEYFRKLKLREARTAYKESLLLDFQPKVFLAYLKTFVPNSVTQLARTSKQ